MHYNNVQVANLMSAYALQTHSTQMKYTENEERIV